MRGRSHAVLLLAGARMRIHFRRVATGGEVIALEILRSPKG